jgi:uncharacterized protein
MIDKRIAEEIATRLERAEQEHDVRILYAVESGSRAWGFASVNSDYDVRFVYAHAQDWYLSIEEQRDVIEYPIVDDIDLNGWDVRKALRLFQKFNPSLMEWLHSPIVYRCDHEFAPALRKEVNAQYSPMRSLHHYLSMAKTNYRGYLKRDKVPLKKYFYVLRPILAANWVERYGRMPPILFSELLELLAPDSEIYRSITALLTMKARSTEKEWIPAIPELNDYIERELTRLSGMQWHDQGRYKTRDLDRVFNLAIA